MSTIDECKPPLMIRIPVNARTEGEAVYLDQFVIGVITPLCPEGFMELVATANVVTLSPSPSAKPPVPQ